MDQKLSKKSCTEAGRISKKKNKEVCEWLNLSHNILWDLRERGIIETVCVFKHLS
jgi:hypothetical protein